MTLLDRGCGSEVDRHGLVIDLWGLHDCSNMVAADINREKELNNTKKALEELRKVLDTTPKIPPIAKVAFDKDNETTVIVWADGSKNTVVKNTSGAPADRYAGFCAAVCKKLFGSTTNTIKVMDTYDVAKIAEKKKAAKAKSEAFIKECKESLDKTAEKAKARRFHQLVDDQLMLERARRRAMEILDKEEKKNNGK